MKNKLLVQIIYSLLIDTVIFCILLKVHFEMALIQKIFVFVIGTLPFFLYLYIVDCKNIFALIFRIVILTVILILSIREVYCEKIYEYLAFCNGVIQIYLYLFVNLAGCIYNKYLKKN